MRLIMRLINNEIIERFLRGGLKYENEKVKNAKMKTKTMKNEKVKNAKRRTKI